MSMTASWWEDVSLVSDKMSEIVLLPTRVEDWVEGDPIMGVLGGQASL